MDKKYYQYYDMMHADKDYAGEVERVVLFAKETDVGKIKKILDVGCGTGGHAFEFAKKGYSVTGIDTDCAIIEIAKQKLKQSKNPEGLQFLCKGVKQLKKSGFDMAVSLFNVVNYIEDTEALFGFFSVINDRLRKTGLFVFDCWNGVAAIIDNPKEKKKSVKLSGKLVEISMTPEVDLMEQRVVVRNTAVVSSSKGQKDRFNFEYVQRLWTPWHLRRVLDSCGFQTLKITSWAEPKTDAKYNTWKIVFVCQKK